MDRIFWYGDGGKLLTRQELKGMYEADSEDCEAFEEYIGMALHSGCGVSRFDAYYHEQCEGILSDIENVLVFGTDKSVDVDMKSIKGSIEYWNELRRIRSFNNSPWATDAEIQSIVDEFNREHL